MGVGDTRLHCRRLGHPHFPQPTGTSRGRGAISGTENRSQWTVSGQELWPGLRGRPAGRFCVGQSWERQSLAPLWPTSKGSPWPSLYYGSCWSAPNWEQVEEGERI